jgi:hypothetical protein
MDEDGLPFFRLLTAAERAATFQAAFSPAVVKLILKPIEQAIEIPKTFAITAWREVYQAVYLTIANTV